MWGWVGELVKAVLEFIQKMVSKEIYAKNADPTANGMRDKFLARVRKFRNSRTGRDSSSTG